jgi:hypothetical protein
LFYSPATKYLHFNAQTKSISYLKIPINPTRLEAPKSLQIPIADDDEEILYFTIINENLPEHIEVQEGEEEEYDQYLEPY